jgi:3-ketosteroid 9alpha-monooxygenase subunit A
MSSAREFPPLPNGWFAVAWSDDLNVGQVKSLRCLERDLVIFRAGDGSVGALDAYCPHLGTHLGVGGRVEGNRIVCPFHHWEFDVTGVCQKIPRAQKIPKKAVIANWSVREVNGVVQIYHHASQHPPLRDPLAFAELEDNSWAVCGRDQYQLQSHPYDLAENGADEVHMRTVHGNAVVNSRLEESETEFATYFEMEPFFGKRRLPFRVCLDSRIRDLGHMIISVRIGQVMSFHIVQYVTPVERGLVDVRHIYMVKGARGFSGLAKRLLARVVLKAALINANRDKPIWNNKSFQRTPVLAEGDAMIGRFRRWARQFYQQDEEVAGNERETSASVREARVRTEPSTESSH